MQVGKLCQKIMDVSEILTAVFGDSDSEVEEDNNVSLLPPPPPPSTPLLYKVVSEDRQKLAWEKIEPVEGLWICQDFLSSQQQEVLLTAIQAEGWFLDPQHNQAMRFGQLPNWAIDLALLVRHAVSAYDDSSSTCCLNGNSEKSQITLEKSFRQPLTHQIVQREPLFDQMTVNSYEPGEVMSLVELSKANFFCIHIESGHNFTTGHIRSCRSS
ncbi:hypothetical protein O6H91_16G032100 [Diphasiastrum complanatum]|uniref:Uncharacterized protein n=1 Tax=Diphasiastrum complanatum TaxID=34168 RepID=A0ACC2BB66_DIPCM|nr:hypothetical protein O6H91_16G032100 [Diphasiastrum complanatum]